jgi:hypothetical protein
MALTFEELNTLSKDPVFQGRVQTAALQYAAYAQLQPAADFPIGYTSLHRWIGETNVNPQAMAFRITQLVVLDAAVMADGGAITDVQLSGAVETVVKTKIV